MIVNNIMRCAFERATANVPMKQRTRTYAMVRSALNRRIGQRIARTGWSVQRVQR